MNNPSVALQTAYFSKLFGREDTYTDSVIDSLIALQPSLICPCSVGEAGSLYCLVPGGDSEISTPIYNAGAWLGVYSDMAPTSATGAYIVLGQQTFVDDADKQVFGTEATQNVTVVTTFDSDVGGKKLTSQIADAILKRIRVRARLPMTGFNMITSTLDSYLTISEQSPTRTIIRAEMRFRHILEQS